MTVFIVFFWQLSTIFPNRDGPPSPNGLRDFFEITYYRPDRIISDIFSQNYRIPDTTTISDTGSSSIIS